jgi:CheY-like chemotaxis protein
MQGQILIIESNEINRNLLLEIFSHESFQVTAVASCSSGLTVIEESNVDLILIDQYHQYKGDATAYNKILNLMPAIPVILLTSNLPDTISNYYMDLGVSDLVKKPYDQSTLLSSARQALAMRH